MLDTHALKSLGIDDAEGLTYCADDMDFYGEMLAEYVNEHDANETRMQRFFEARDWANYRILMHSVKNTSRMIGASDLSEKAHGLELAAKEGDESALRTAHTPFLADYAALADGLREMIG